MRLPSDSRVARVAVVAAIAAAFLVAFDFVARQIARVSVALAAPDEIEAHLRQTLADQKTLAGLDPAHVAEYRRKFDTTQELLRHLHVVALNRQAMTRSMEDVLVASVAVILAAAIAIYAIERKRRERRLVRLEGAVAALSRGEGEIVLGDRSRDVLGRIATAIESSSRSAARDRRRLKYLEHLSSWQEAARRHAHEIRTPLAAARMEIERLTERMLRLVPSAADEIDDARSSLFEEINHIREFTRRFASVATIPPPRLRDLDLRELLETYCESLGRAWTNTALVLDASGPAHAPVLADPDLLRQVLANLASNASLAFGDAPGNVRIVLRQHEDAYWVDVADDGPGIAPSIRSRLFEPYATTRNVGDGMGLGLAISKKIMLDHGGDLDFVDSSSPGATFRLTLPAARNHDT